MKIGAHTLRNGLIVAPMAGVTDRPFRTLARRFGADLAVTEMTSAKPGLRDTRKSRLRREHSGEAGPVSVQIAGSDPEMLADAARFNADHGAQIIDINMGCPAKKVCNVYAGSALLSDEALVGRILDAVVAAVDLPVTLKIRTGPQPEQRNAVRIARIAEQAGVTMLAVHGRTRACGFRGAAEFETIKEVKRAVRIPVVANGDIRTPQEARRVLDETRADGIMIGRAAQGRPWIFREIAHFLATGRPLAPVSLQEIRAVLTGHLDDLYSLYGEEQGVRIARKHIGWTIAGLPRAVVFRKQAFQLNDADAQHNAVQDYFDLLTESGASGVAGEQTDDEE